LYFYNSMSRCETWRHPTPHRWPLWYHRVCLVHNRAFGWLDILGLVGGAVTAAGR
jgi:hypothetical protein